MSYKTQRRRAETLENESNIRQKVLIASVLSDILHNEMKERGGDRPGKSGGI